MARIRTIKPEFFQHEQLYDAEHSAGLPLRIAFAGLWTVADKAGRFEWRPRQLKLNVLPYDDLDFEAVLAALAAAGFVVRYTVDGKQFGSIPSWEKHQHVNIREPDSSIPPPAEGELEQVQAPVEAGASTGPVSAQSVGKGREGKGKEGNGKGKGAARADTCTPPVPAIELHSTLPATEWQEWIELRRRKKWPVDPLTLGKQLKLLRQYDTDTQRRMIDASIGSGWQGIFEPKGGQAKPAAVVRRAKSAAEIEAEEKQLATG